MSVKKIAFSVITAASLVTTNSFGLSSQQVLGTLSNFLSTQGLNLQNFVNQLFNTGGLSNYIGEIYALSNAKLYCPDTNVLSGNSLCDIAQSSLSLSNKVFEIPFCSITLNLNSFTKPFEGLSKICSSGGQLSYNAFDFINTPKNIVEMSNQKFDFFKNSSLCGTSSQTGTTTGAAQTESKFVELVEKEADTKSYFDNAGKIKYECVELALKNGADPEQMCATEKLFSPSNKDEVKAREDIDTIVKENLKEESFVDTEASIENEHKISEDLLVKCSNYDDLKDSKECEDKYYEQEYGIKEKKGAAYKEIEANQAQISTVTQKAAEAEYTIVLPTEEMKEKIPSALRRDFVFLSDKIFAKEVMVAYYENEIVNLKKELADLLYEKKVVCTRQFYPKPYKKTLKTLMENLDAE